MARLNTTSRRQDARSLQEKPGFVARTTGITKEHRQTTSMDINSLTRSTTSLSGSNGTLNRKQSQKQKAKNTMDFPIFYDSDAFIDKEAEETDNDDGYEYGMGSGSSSIISPSSSVSSPFSRSMSSDTSRDSLGHESKNKNPLSLTHVNSMILPLSQQQARHTRRPTNTTTTTTTSTTASRTGAGSPKPEENDNYDKENDPIEQEPEDDFSLSRSASDASSRRGPNRNNSNASNRNRTRLQFSQREVDERASSDDDAFDDSLNDFIVSDNDDISYQESSASEDSEEEARKVPSPPPSTRPGRRLMRGRRPAPRISDSESEVEPRKSKKPAPPVASPTALSSSGKFQENVDITDQLSDLHLQDNDPSSQLLQGLNRYVTNVPMNETEPDSPSAVIELDSPAMPKRASTKKTPPSSPSKGSRLQSPTKSKVNIPPTPFRENTDAFWSQTTTNDWIDQHSPSKVEKLLRELEDSDDENGPAKSFEIMPRTPRGPKKDVKPLSKTAQKKAEIANKKAQQARKQAFDEKKLSLAYSFYKLLDDSVASGQIQEMTKESGGVKIIFSKTLQTTAGRATSKRAYPSSSGQGSSPAKDQYQASIELAERIIDSEDRLINTLAHEYCHLTNTLISRVRNNPHGTSFKQWGLRCKQALQNHPDYAGRVEVTTKHNYQIDFKYVWACVDCAQSFGRHSKSINPAAVRCGRCKGILQQVKPKPRNCAGAKKQAAQAAAGLGMGMGMGMGMSISADRRTVDDVMQVFEGVTLD